MNTGDAHHLLFTYGPLRYAEVQLDTFGRVLVGTPDSLPGYTLDYIDMSTSRAAAGPSMCARLRRTGNPVDRVVGILVHLTTAELDAADDREALRHRRERVRLTSGRDAWVYAD